MGVGLVGLLHGAEVRGARADWDLCLPPARRDSTIGANQRAERGGSKQRSTVDRRRTEGTDMDADTSIQQRYGFTTPDLYRILLGRGHFSPKPWKNYLSFDDCERVAPTPQLDCARPLAGSFSDPSIGKG